MTPWNLFRQGLGRLALGDQRMVGVHLDPEEGAIVQTLHRRDGPPTVEKIARVPFSGMAAPDQARHLRERWIEKGFTGDLIVSTFPQRRAIVKTLTLPATDPREISEMAKLQAYRRIPLPAEEMEVRCRLIERTAEGYSIVKLIVIRKDDIRRHLNVFHQAGIAPDRLILDSWAQESSTDWVVWAAARGAEDSFSLRAALGASLSDPHSKDNLLPAEELKRKRQASRAFERKTTLILSLVLVLLGAGHLLHRFHEREATLSRLTREAKDIAAEAQELRRMQLKTQMIRNQMAKNGSFLHVMADLNKAAPGRISIQAVAFDRNRTLRIKGTSFSLSEVLRWVGALQKMPLFSKVELASSSSRRAQEEDLIDFQLSCQWGLAGHPAKKGADL